MLTISLDLSTSMNCPYCSYCLLNKNNLCKSVITTKCSRPTNGASRMQRTSLLELCWGDAHWCRTETGARRASATRAAICVPKAATTGSPPLQGGFRGAPGIEAPPLQPHWPSPFRGLGGPEGLRVHQNEAWPHFAVQPGLQMNKNYYYFIDRWLSA